MVFPSKIDTWLVLVTGAALLLPLVLGVRALQQANFSESLIAFGSVTAVVLVLVLLVVPCRYTLKSDHLLIQSGLMRQRIPYDRITRVEPTSNPLSAPALSLQRVKISYDGLFQLVSPVERDRFIEALNHQIAQTDVPPAPPS